MNRSSSIFITEEMFPIHTIVKNALSTPVCSFIWYVERNPVNEKILQEALGDEFKYIQYGYYLENSKGFIPHLDGDHIALDVVISGISLNQLKTLAKQPKVFKIFHKSSKADSTKPSLTHPFLFVSGDGIDKIYNIRLS